MLITLSGASAVGKTSAMKRLLRELPHARLLRSVTTRAPRPTDAGGEYLHVTPMEFALHKERGEFAWEPLSFVNASYGTLARDVRLALAADELFLAAIVPSFVPTIHEFAAVEGFARCVRSIYIKSPGRDILLRRLTVDRREPEEVARRKIEECAEWDKLAFNTTRLGHSAYYFVGDRDDFEEKYDHLRRLVTRPWF